MLVNAFNGTSSNSKSSNKKKYDNDYDDAVKSTTKELLGAAKEMSREYRDSYSKNSKNRKRGFKDKF